MLFFLPHMVVFACFLLVVRDVAFVDLSWYIGCTNACLSFFLVSVWSAGIRVRIFCSVWLQLAECPQRIFLIHHFTHHKSLRTTQQISLSFLFSSSLWRIGIVSKFHIRLMEINRIMANTLASLCDSSANRCQRDEGLLCGATGAEPWITMELIQGWPEESCCLLLSGF